MGLYVTQNRFDDLLEFEVRDSGIGMTDEEQKNLFSLFLQEEAAGMRQTGCGLGLTVSYKLV